MCDLHLAINSSQILGKNDFIIGIIMVCEKLNQNREQQRKQAKYNHKFYNLKKTVIIV